MGNEGVSGGAAIGFDRLLLDGLVKPLNLRLEPHQLANHRIGDQLNLGGCLLLIGMDPLDPGKPALQVTVEMLVEPRGDRLLQRRGQSPQSLHHALYDGRQNSAPLCVPCRVLAKNRYYAFEP